jgi:hypothetical protein
MKVTVRQYYRGFVSLFGIFAGVTFLPPVLHFFIPDSSAIAEYLYPPLGDSQQLTLAATFLVLSLTTYVVFKWRESAPKEKWYVASILWAGLVLGVVAWIVLCVHYVRRIPVPTMGLEIPVSIGFERTDFALRWYSNSSDWEMLHYTGPWEDNIQELWTPSSICVVRVLLWLSYTMSLACFLAVVSLAAYQHAAEEAAEKALPPDQLPQAGGPGPGEISKAR